MINPRLHALISLLSDGRFHSGEALGKALGVSRAAIWKYLKGLEPYGLVVQAVTGKGYRLATPFTPLDRDTILGQLEPDTRPLLAGLELLPEIDSTNRFLLKEASDAAPSGTACLAEYQSSGRGRRGRQWLSPYGSNLALSLLWRFNDGTGRLGGLSLAVAVALMRCLTELGVSSAGIKWPNDILINGHKLAGILLDVAGQSAGPCYVVMGIGLNYRMPESMDSEIDQAWTDLWHVGIESDRNIVAGRLLHHLLRVVRKYQEQGLEAFRAEWRGWDLTRDQQVDILLGENVIPGIARGIDAQGLLQVEHTDGLKCYASGEVSLRTAAQ